MEREQLISTVIQAQQGDSQALSDLFNAYYQYVFQFAMKTVGDPDIAMDITQETFVEIINTIADLKEPAAFVKWMRLITYHQCTRHFKKKVDVQAEEDEDGYSVLDAIEEEKTAFIPDAALDQQDFRNTIQDILDALPEEQRTLLMLCYYDELSYSEISEITGLSEKTIGNRLFAARKKMKSAVEDYEKKNNVKLRSVGLLPLLLWLWNLQKGSMPPKAMAEAASYVGAKTGVTITIAKAATEAVTATAVSAATKTATATGTAAVALSTKIIAGVVAALLAVSGTVASILVFGPERVGPSGATTGGDPFPTNTTGETSATDTTDPVVDLQTPSVGLLFESNKDGTCAMVGLGTCMDSVVVVPGTSPEGDVVTTIGSNAFFRNMSITHVAFPDSVTTIQAKALKQQASLCTVIWPASLETIGEDAFYGTALKELRLPGSVTEIGEGAFEQCESLTSVVLPDSILSLGDRCFANDFLLATVQLPANLTRIPQECFEDCDKLTEIVLPAKVGSIGSRAFMGCHTLQKISLPKSMLIISDGAFYGCRNLTEILFAGTKAQWDEIYKETGFRDWNGSTGAYTVICSDGSVSK